MRLSLWLPLAALSRGNPTQSHRPLSSGFPALRLQPSSGATLSSSADPCRRRQPRRAVLATGKFEPEVEDVHFPHFPVLAVRGPDNRRARARGGGGGPPGRSVAPAAGSLHPFEGKKCQGQPLGAPQRGDPVPTVMHLRPQPSGSALETVVSSCGRRGKWDTQRGEERGRVAATEEPRARGCGTGCPVSLSSSGVAEGKGASAVPLSSRTLGDRGAAPAIPERTALQPSPLAWSPVQSWSRQSLAGGVSAITVSD